MLRTLYININGFDIQSDSNMEVIGSVEDTIIDSFYISLGMAIADGVSGIKRYKPLVVDFATEKSEEFKIFAEQWEKLKTRLLGTNPSGIFEFVLPPEYLEWLKMNAVYSDVYYKKFQEQRQYKIDLYLDELYEDIITPICRKVTRFLNSNDNSKNFKEFVVNDKDVVSRSLLVNSIIEKANCNISFVPYHTFCRKNELELSENKESFKSSEKDWFEELVDKIISCGLLEIHEGWERKMELHLCLPNDIIKIVSGYIEVKSENKYIKPSETGYTISVTNAINDSIDILKHSEVEIPKDVFTKYNIALIKDILFKDVTGKLCLNIREEDDLTEWQTYWHGLGLKDGWSDMYLFNGKYYNHFVLNLSRIIPTALNFNIKQNNYTQFGSVGMRAYEYKGKFGFIKSDEIVIPPIYEDADNFNCEMAPVKHNGKYGYVDKYGKEKIPFIFSHATMFNMHGIAIVIKEGVEKGIKMDGTLFDII